MDGVLFHYVVVRLDLPDGMRLAQTIHAAGVSGRLVHELPGDTHAVALGAKTEASLLELEARLLEAGIPHALIREPDAPYEGAALALGVAPLQKSPLTRRLFGRLRLIT